MKKTSQKLKAKKAPTPARKHEPIAPLEDAPILDTPADEPDLAVDHFAVAGHVDEATSTGHRVEPIEEDDEHNA